MTNMYYFTTAAYLRVGEWSLNNHESRKIFVEFRGSRSLVMCILQTRFVLESL